MRDRRKEAATEFCVGCGLCESVLGGGDAALRLGSDGFYHPVLNADGQVLDRLQAFCPALRAPERYEDSVWGAYQDVFLSHATDEALRKKASSGGFVSAAACFLLRRRLVDGIIHTGMGTDSIYPEVKLSQTEEEVRVSAGSRYIVTTPLRGVMELLDANPARKYALIARPCDIRALRAAQKTEEKLSWQIPYLFSFFCAGASSGCATVRMAGELGIAKEEIAAVAYRGDGWPGMAAVTDKSGRVARMGYEDSWGKILGRDIMKGCRYCFDGVGEYADLSAGDAWYLDERGTPSFEERDGRNVVFARTEKGLQLAQEMAEAGEIAWEPFESRIGELARMQPYQYEKKSFLGAKVVALKLCGRNAPPFDLRALRRYRKITQAKRQLRMFAGTMLRIVRKEI